MRLSLEEAIRRARSAGPARQFPLQDDPRLRDGAMFPEIQPRFSLTPGSSIFTLGSCFARSVEERLQGFVLPTLSLATPRAERPGRPNGVLNEYNPATICQRLEHAARGEAFGDLCIAPEADGVVDLLLPEYVTPSTRERLLARRSEVDAVYGALPRCEAVIIAFDVVEAWYDTASGLYLNRIPPSPVLLADRSRFELHILDIAATQPLFARMVSALDTMGVGKVILTVSPAALEATYSGRDCVTANAFSKAVLVVCATELHQSHAHIDYFPGYEIVVSAGPAFYEPDSVHLRDDALDLVTDYLIARYAA